MIEQNHLRLIMDVQQQMMLSNFDVNVFMQTVCDRMCTLTKADGSTIELLEQNKMVYRSTSGILVDHLGTHVNVDASLSGTCLKQKKVLYSADTENDDRVDINATIKVGARSMVCVPLFESNRSVGVLKVISTRPNAFSNREIETLQLLSMTLGAELGKQLMYEEKERVLQQYEQTLEQLRDEIGRRRQLENELTLLAERDVLTGLLNRRAFHNSVRKWILQASHDDTFGVFFLDIDKFKSYNDNYGHEIGDLVLMEFANRMTQSVGSSDLVARFGGDEFVIASRITHSNCLLNIAKRMFQQLDSPFCFKGLEIMVKTSCGCTVWSAGKSEEELIQIADRSMYVAKSSGPNRVAIDGKIVY